MAHRHDGSVRCPLRLTVSYLATSETEAFRPTYYTLDHRRYVALVLLWDGHSLRGLVEAQILDPDRGAPDGRKVERPRLWKQAAEALFDLARSGRGETARLSAFLERSSHGQRIARRAIPSYDDGNGDSSLSEAHQPAASTDCWDFYAGAAVRYEDFRERDDLYATAIRGPADLDLDTRFVERRTMQ